MNLKLFTLSFMLFLLACSKDEQANNDYPVTYEFENFVLKDPLCGVVKGNELEDIPIQGTFLLWDTLFTLHLNELIDQGDFFSELILLNETEVEMRAPVPNDESYVATYIISDGTLIISLAGDEMEMSVDDNMEMLSICGFNEHISGVNPFNGFIHYFTSSGPCEEGDANQIRNNLVVDYAMETNDTLFTVYSDMVYRRQ